jgi:hypothetical protein
MTIVRLAMNTSSIAIRLITNHRKSVASRIPPAIEAKREQRANHSARIAANRPSVPKASGRVRQPSGPSPNNNMPSPIISLPNSGCSTLTGCDSASSARAAGT